MFLSNKCICLDYHLVFLLRKICGFSLAAPIHLKTISHNLLVVVAYRDVCSFSRTGAGGGAYRAFFHGPRIPYRARARICKPLRSQGIDFKESIPPAYVAELAGTSDRVVVPARKAGNRFLAP